MTPDRECPGEDCRQRFLTAHALARHYARHHADYGRWTAGRQLVADGGVVEVATEEMLDDADPQGVSDALDLCLDQEDGEGVERIGRYFEALGKRMQEDQR
jgi:hypothetical protein